MNINKTTLVYNLFLCIMLQHLFVTPTHATESHSGAVFEISLGAP